ncbi:tetratricopeptide repeat protein [Candidatus Poribacteria bacterium]
MKQIIPILVLVLALVKISSAGDLLVEADGFYDLRAIGFNEGTLLASATNIDKAIELYRAAIKNTSGPDKEEAIWKLMRAYYFKGRYTVSDKGARKAIYDKAKAIGAEGIKEFPESAAIHTWMAAIWGVWAEEHGTLKAARKGVAGKIKKHCEKAIELDETFGGAGGYYILGRTHFKAPKIPLILRWPSKKKAVELLEKAYEIEPRNLFTKQFLAEALYERGRKDRAIELMEGILGTHDVIVGVAEDAVIKSEVTETLKKWRK